MERLDPMFLSQKEAAAFIGITPRHLRNLTLSRVLGPHGPLYRFEVIAAEARKREGRPRRGRPPKAVRVSE
jgi:hypothetical protein